MAGRADVIVKSGGRFVEMGRVGWVEERRPEVIASCLWLILLEDCQ